jgi:hypothetical protein
MVGDFIAHKRHFAMTYVGQNVRQYGTLTSAPKCFIVDL